MFICSMIDQKVRETVSRRLQTTRIWDRWKRCLGKKEQDPHGITMEENATIVNTISIVRGKIDRKFDIVIALICFL